MTIEQRLAKLERQNRWMKRGGGLALAAIACVVLMGQGTSEEFPDLVANSLTIKDSRGVARIFLDLWRDHPRLVMRDVNGRRVVDINVHPDGSNLKIRSRTHKSSLTLSASKLAAMLTVRDKLGLVRSKMGVSGDGKPGLAVLGHGGNPVWQAPPK